MGSLPLTRFMPPRGVPLAAFFSAQAAPGSTTVLVAMLRPTLEKKASGPVLMRVWANCAGAGRHFQVQYCTVLPLPLKQCEFQQYSTVAHQRSQPHLSELLFVKLLVSIGIKSCHSRLNGKCVQSAFYLVSHRHSLNMYCTVITQYCTFDVTHLDVGP